MTETNHLSGGAADPLDNRSPNLTPAELALIGYFVRGQKHSTSSQNLKLEYTETSIRLSDCNGKLLGISKQVNQWQRKVLISNNSVYRDSTVQALAELGFITKQKSSHPDFTEHHYYTIPEGYKLNYTEAIQLWKIWWNTKRYQLNTSNPSIDILTFSKGNWHLIQDLQPKQGNFVLRTGRGEIKIEPGEYVVWIDLLPMALENAEPKSGYPAHAIGSENQQKLSAHPSVLLDSSLLSEPNNASEISSSSIRFSSRETAPSLTRLDGSIDDGSLADPNRHIISPKAYIDRLPAPEEDIDLESYLSTFNTEDTEDIDRIEGIYNIGELLGGNTAIDDLTPPSITPRSPHVTQTEVTTHPEQIAAIEQPVLTPLPTRWSSSDREASLKHKAMQVLANYLRVGDRIVRTEVLKNAQGQEINRKVTKIQRGCPSWAIEQIKKLEQ